MNKPSKPIHKIRAIWNAKKTEVLQLGKGLAAGLVATFLFAAFAPDAGQYIKVYICFLTLLGSLRLIYILAPNQELFDEQWAKAKRTLTALETQQKLYVRVVLFAVICMLSSLIAAPMVTRSFLILTMCFAAHVAFYDVRRWYRYVSETLLGKAIIGLAFAVSTNFAYSFASQKIAEVIHVTPTNMTYTRLFVAILTIPVLMSLGGAIVYFAVGVVMPFLIAPLHMFKRMPPQLKGWLFADTLPESAQIFPFATLLFQILFYACMGWITWGLGEKGMVYYKNKMPGVVSSLVYEYDMYPGRECKIGDGNKVAPLGDAKFLVAQRDPNGTITFYPPIKCDDLPATLAEVQRQP
jgi:hypothetical protein